MKTLRFVLLSSLLFGLTGCSGCAKDESKDNTKAAEALSAMPPTPHTDRNSRFAPLVGSAPSAHATIQWAKSEAGAQ